MTVGVVYRPLARNEHGDPIDADGNVVHADDAPYGEIDVISGGTSGSTRTTYPLTNLRGDVVSTEGMLGWRTDSRIQLQAGDTVVADGQKLKVIGPACGDVTTH